MTQTFNERNIVPDTKLEDIFPRSNRRQNVKGFEKSLGFSVDILSMKGWLAMTILVGFTISILSLFFSWQAGTLGLIFFSLFTWTVSKFSKELDISTVRELTEKISRENYSLSRRKSETVNRREIVKIIQDVFVADHLIDREALTMEATLGWN